MCNALTHKHTTIWSAVGIFHIFSIHFFSFLLPYLFALYIMQALLLLCFGGGEGGNFAILYLIYILILFVKHLSVQRYSYRMFWLCIQSHLNFKTVQNMHFFFTLYSLSLFISLLLSLSLPHYHDFAVCLLLFVSALLFRTHRIFLGCRFCFVISFFSRVVALYSKAVVCHIL